MDRIFEVKSPESFTRLRLAGDIRAMKDGDLYYPVTEFTTDHADTWLNMLLQLQQGGWNSEHLNLSEVFLASIHTCNLVFDEAKKLQASKCAPADRRVKEMDHYER